MAIQRHGVTWPRAALLGLLLWPWLAVQAEAELPGRVGRLVPLQGEVSVIDPEAGAWVAAPPNLPVTGGSRVATATGARAELRVGSTILRLGGASDLEVQRLDDAGMVFQLHAGSLALNVRSADVASQVSVLTAEAAFTPLRAGSYRFDRHDLTTLAGSQRGELLVDSAGGWVVGAGQRIEVWRDGSGRELRQAWATAAHDEFASWLASADREADRATERLAAAGWVSPEMTGAEELDRHGRWDRHPEHGVVWLPYTVAAGWAPYRHGRWTWVPPWGWTWVDAAPWGFAPFHYGRWVSWGGRWCWSPGPFVARPVYAPALVRCVGGPPPHWRDGRSHPGVGWLPLAPHEAFVPGRTVMPVVRRPLHPVPPPPTAAPRVFLAAPGAIVAAPAGAVPTRPPSAPAAALPTPFVPTMAPAAGGATAAIAPARPPAAAPLHPPAAAPLHSPAAAPLHSPAAAPLHPPGAAPLHPPGAAPLHPPGAVAGPAPQPAPVAGVRPATPPPRPPAPLAATAPQPAPVVVVRPAPPPPPVGVARPPFNADAGQGDRRAAVPAPSGRGAQRHADR